MVLVLGVIGSIVMSTQQGNVLPGLGIAAVIWLIMFLVVGATLLPLLGSFWAL